jgi:peptidoglycan/LPS O-acetylase OafA/YrhL
VSVGGFYLRRLWRIQPAAIVFLLVVGALGLSGVLTVSGPGWQAALLGYANFAMASQTWSTVHFWSLAVEEHFYLLWPLLFALLGPRRRLAGSVGIALLLAAWLGIVVRYQVADSPYLWVRSDIEGSWVMWGCVAALAEATPAGARLIALLSRPGISLVALPLAVTCVVFRGLDWKIVCATTVLTAAATPLLLIGTVRRPRGWLGSLLELQALAWLGRISYSVYLWQEIFFVWDDERSVALGALQSPPWRLMLTLACAAASYYAIEKPAIRLGARLLGGRAPARPPEGLRTAPAKRMKLVRRRTPATRAPGRHHSRR